MIPSRFFLSNIIQTARKLHTGTVRGIITLSRQSNISIQQCRRDVSDFDLRSTTVDNHVGSSHVAAEAARQEAGDSGNLRWHACTLEANVLFL